MPKYVIKLSDPDSKHFRVTVLHAPSEAEAREVVERRELRAVAFRLADKELAELLGKPEDELSGRERGILHTHRQSSPYEVTYISEGGSVADVISLVSRERAGQKEVQA